MDIKRHLIAAGLALLAFLILSMLSGPLGMPVVYALFGIVLAATALYFHYRRRAARQALVPKTPGRDDRVIPQEVKEFVFARDEGVCQLQYADICLYDREIQYDHRWPWSKGGSSKDPENIQLACAPCNRHKSDKILV